MTLPLDGSHSGPPWCQYDALLLGGAPAPSNVPLCLLPRADTIPSPPHFPALLLQHPPLPPSLPPSLQVGQKPSRAPYYLNDPAEVLQLMARLVGVTLDSRS